MEEKRSQETTGKRIRFLDVFAVCCIVLCLVVLYGMLRPKMQAGEKEPPRETLWAIQPTEETEPVETAPSETEPPMEKLRQAEAGDTVFFGTFEQDGITDNGPEPIEWIVLAREEGQILVISKSILDCRPFHLVRVPVTWEDSTLRSWLNGDFFSEVFSEAERAMIPVVTVTPGKNPNYNTDPGMATEDRVFLLSPEEAKGFGLMEACPATAFASQKGADPENCCWWVCAPGLSQNNAAYAQGAELGDDHVNKHFGIRPAIWIQPEP